MMFTNTYKQVLNQTLNNAWLQDAYICEATCENDSEGQNTISTQYIFASGRKKKFNLPFLIYINIKEMLKNKND